MIAKVTSGGGFRGVLNYLMQQKEQAREVAQEKGQERGQERQEGRELSSDGGQRGHDIDARQGSERAVERERNVVEPDRAEGRGATPESGRKGLERSREEGEGEKAERHRLIGGNMTGRTARELAQEFGAVREQRPDIEKPVHHVSLSAAPGERLSVEQWNQIAEKYVERMGFRDSPYVVIQHTDKEHDHVHIVASRIDLHGKVISEFQSKMRAEGVMREVEREHKLEQVRPSIEIERAAPTRGEMEQFNRTGELSAKMRLQGHVDRALKEGRTASEFVERLDRVGVEVIPNLQSTGRMSGISFRLDGELMKGSDLGRGYSWQGLQKQGLEYEQERDLPALREAQNRVLLERVGERVGFAAERAQSAERRQVAEASREIEGRSAGQHLLDRVNAAGPDTDQARIYDQLRQVAAAEGRSATQETAERQDVAERLQRAAGIEPDRDERGAVERINRAAGVEERREPTVERSREEEKAVTHEQERAPAIEHTREREHKEQEQTRDRGHDRGYDYGWSR